MVCTYEHYGEYAQTNIKMLHFKKYCMRMKTNACIVNGMCVSCYFSCASV